MSVLQESKNYVWMSLIFFSLCIGGIVDEGVVSLIMFFVIVYCACRIEYIQEPKQKRYMV